jgi:ribosomal protein S18 acetylase RimI-like enzyme
MAPSDPAEDYTICDVDETGLAALVAHIEDHLEDNGRDGTPIFQPQSRETPWLGSEKIALFRAGLAAAVGAPGWRRWWTASDAAGRIAGHVDLHPRPDPAASHRALLGMGVHRDHRRRGLGRRLLAHAVAWAREETDLVWIDLSVLGGNAPAARLYRSAGFQEIATVADMFRVDGTSVADIAMTLRIRP